MNAFTISGLLTGVTSLAFGYFVYSKGQERALNRLWFFFTVSVALWGFGGAWIGLAKTPAEALWAWRLAFACGVLWIPVLFYHFVCIFCGISRRTSLVACYALAVLFFPIIFTSLFFSNVRWSFSSFYYSMPGGLFPVFVFWWVGVIVYSHFELFRAYGDTSGQKRTQIKYFFLATAIGYSGGTLDYLPIFGVDVYPYGNFAIILYPIIMTYAIVKYRLMDITVVVHKGLGYGLLLGLIFVPAYVAVLISHRATPHSIPPLIAATCILACGLWIVLKNPKAITNITFGLISLAVSAWLFGAFMGYSTTDRAAIDFWGKFAYLGVVYIPALFYQFCTNFLQSSPVKRLLWSNYLIATFFLVLIPTPYLLNGHYTYFWGTYPKAGPLHALFVAYFVLASAVSFRSLYQGYKAKKTTAPLESTRIQYILWAFIIGYCASLDFIQHYGVEFYPVGYLFACLWVITVTYAILKYQLLDIATTTRTQVLPYAQALALIPSYFLILGLIRVFTGSMQYILAGILLATFAILAELLVTLQQRMEKLVGKAFFRKKYDAYETLTEFSGVLVAILDLNALNEKIIGTLSKVMRIQSISLFLLDREKDDYFLVASHGMNVERLKEVKVRRLAQYLKETDRVIVKEELERGTTDDLSKQVLKNMVLLQAELCVPLRNKERVIGFLNLGHKANLEMYSQEDINLLFTLGQNAAIALDNALLYEDLRRQKMLIRRTDRLRSLETMAGGFAHEIRNPLTSIKTFVQLTPQRKDDPEFVGQFGTLVCEDVARIERLIQEILDYAKYMEPKFMPENLNEVVSSSLYFVKVNADRKSVAIDKDFADHLPLVMLDRQQIKQVLLNLFLNALHAMGRDGGRLSVKTHGLVKQDGAKWVQIEVGDSGCGIPAEDLDHIFDPFYTTKHESEEREGTGLGLAIVHQIIREHGGYIEVQSEVGRGTTFYLNLPVLKKTALGDEAAIKKPAFSADRTDG